MHPPRIYIGIAIVQKFATLLKGESLRQIKDALALWIFRFSKQDNILIDKTTE